MPDHAEVCRRLRENFEFGYAHAAPTAAATVAERIRAAGLAGEPISYSDAVRGIPFDLDVHGRPRPFTIDVHDWWDIDRAIVGSVLGSLCAETYDRSRCLISALVIRKPQDLGRGWQRERVNHPSPPFFKFATDLGLYGGHGELDELDFWTRQLNAAIAWFRGAPARDS